MILAPAVANVFMALLVLIIWCAAFVIPAAAIQTGQAVTDPTQYPFYAMLGNPHVCGGLFLSLNPPIVLTAAHCVADAPHPDTLTKRNPYFVGYSNVDRRKQKTLSIVDWVIHPKYYGGYDGAIDMHHDIALIKLAEPITGEPLDRVSRVALWPPHGNLKSPQGTLMGFGYTGVNEPEANVLQYIPLNITRLAAGFPDMVEAMSSHDDQRACHGDSGSPLIIQQPYNTTTEAIYAVGILARIFGVYDSDSAHPTCPIPIHFDSSTPSVIESFCNLSNMLPWIASVTGFMTEELTDPFLTSPTPCYNATDCPGRWTAIHSEDTQTTHPWNIGFGGNNQQVDHSDKWWIGPIVKGTSHAWSSSSRSLFLNNNSLLLPTISLLSICVTIIA